MPRPIALLLALALCGASSALAAAPDSDADFRAFVADLQSAGELGYEEALLLRFQRALAPEDLPQEAESVDPVPDKSLTLLIHEFESAREGLSPGVVGVIDEYLDTADEAPALLHLTDRFRFEYRLDGAHAVPAEDLDGSGTPDFVERAGAWAEFSLDAYADAGFAGPLTQDGRVHVSFREMNAYGYARVEDGVPALTLHRNFANFPPNRDPEGHAAGAAKVTVAHELKHASQYASSGWAEGGWLEADATWAENFVFDETDDYVRYLSSNSPVSSPGNWMPVSYEDCLWQQCLEQAMGPAVLVDFFDRREAHPEEAVLQSFARVLEDRGTSLSEAAATLGAWSYFSGANAGGPAGFPDAELFPTPPLRAVLSQSGDSSTDVLAPLGTHYVMVPRADRAGAPEVSFIGQRDAGFALSAVITQPDGTRRLLGVPMVSPTTSAAALPTSWEQTASIVLIATHVHPNADAQYSLTFNDENSVGAPELQNGAALTLEPNFPNPFRHSTTLSFSLSQPDAVRLAVYDVAGRLVRRLHDGRSLPAGSHEAIWDGIDEAGRLSAPGIYYYRLESTHGSVSRRMLLLR